MKQIIECVPNVSEGRDQSIIDQIAGAITSVRGVKLLHTDCGNSANRTVFTLAGEPASVIEAAYRLYEKTTSLIDMRQHSGIHPRIGAVDVCPLIPVRDIAMDEVVDISYQLASRVGNELGIPVYCYGYSAKKSQRMQLENIRRGEYEGFEQKITDTEWHPDYGPAKFIPSFGATVIGARDYLIAFNVNLKTDSVDTAKKIAAKIRESGHKVKNNLKGEDRVTHVPGLLKAVKAIGWYSNDHRCAQVSTNITNYKETSIIKVYQTISAVAKESGTSVSGSELIGLVPLSAVLISETAIENTDEVNRLIDQTEKELRIVFPGKERLRERIVDFLLINNE